MRGEWEGISSLSFEIGVGGNNKRGKGGKQEQIKGHIEKWKERELKTVSETGQIKQKKGTWKEKNMDGWGVCVCVFFKEEERGRGERKIISDEKIRPPAAPPTYGCHLEGFVVAEIVRVGDLGRLPLALVVGVVDHGRIPLA